MRLMLLPQRGWRVAGRLGVFYGSLLAVILCTVTLRVAPVSAHELETDGTITAILHTTPDDDPVSGKPVQYLVFMDDNTRRFSLAGCMCTATIQEHSRLVGVQKLVPNQQLVPGGTFTFPRAGDYDIIISGQPLQPGGFQPFSLDFAVHVGQGVANTQLRPVATALILAGVGLVAVAALVACIWQVRLYYKE